MATKVYVLLDALDVDSQAFQQLPNGQRSQIKKIPWHRPYLRLPVTDEEGVSRMLRYKSTSKYHFEDEQLDKEKIDANAKFTDAERDENRFKYGVLVTTKVHQQEFLEINPEFEGSKYTSDNVKRKTYKLMDKAIEAKDENKSIVRRVRAMNKILSLDLEDAQAMIIRLNGTFVETPTDVEDCQNMLVRFLDDHDGEEAIDAVMKEDKNVTVDDKTKVLIGKLINAKLLSFDEKKGAVVKKDAAGKWLEVREISDEYSPEERVRYFNEFLNTDDGKLLKSDLEKELASSKSKKDSKT